MIGPAMLAGGRRGSCRRTGDDAAQSAAAATITAARARAAVDAFLAGAESRAAALASSKPRLEAIDGGVTGGGLMMIAGMRAASSPTPTAWLRPEALPALGAVDLILHADDVNGLSIMRVLERCTPPAARRRPGPKACAHASLTLGVVGFRDRWSPDPDDG